MANMVTDQLILFTRYPEAGQTKTRLIPVLGAEGAADFQRHMTERLVGQVKKFQEQRAVSFAVRFAGGDAAVMRQWLGDLGRYAPQQGENLGARLQQAFSAAFAEGFQKVVVIGADCPALSPQILAEAFCLLEKNDVVLGPARDGGYYLVGLRAPHAELFTQVAWGTGDVLAQTIENASRIHLSVKLLEPLADVDRPEDLRHICYNSSAE